MSTKEDKKMVQVPLSQEELEALTKDLQEVLIKHNAEMGVSSSINLMKVVEEGSQPTPSPKEFVTDDKETDNKEEEKDTVSKTD